MTRHLLHALLLLCLASSVRAQVGAQLDNELKAQRDAVGQQKDRLDRQAAAILELQDAVKALTKPAEPTLTANKPEAAEGNSAYLDRVMAEGKTVYWPLGDIWLARTPCTPATVSCGRWEFCGAGGYSIVPTKQWGKVSTRLIMPSGMPFLRVCGAGFILNGPVEPIGKLDAAGIEVEGRANPATGHCEFRGIHFRDWQAPIRALAGYYDGSKFVVDENHADNSLAENCTSWNCPTGVFWSQNQQAVNWVFRRWMINNDRTVGPQVAFDIERGGKVLADTLEGAPNLTIFRVRDYSPNNCELMLRNFEFDLYNFPTKLTLFQYAGKVWPDYDMSWFRWRVRADGFVSPQPYKKDAEGNVVKDASGNPKTLLDLKWIDAECKGAKKPIDTSDIKWDVRGIDK